MTKFWKNSNGITLIALVITIVILIIIASISIAVLTGENGLFARAIQAKKNTLDSQDMENITIADYENKINSLIGENNSDNEVEEKTELEKLGEKYVQDGLIVWYDGKYNSGENHDNKTKKWKNIAPISENNVEGQNDGTLMNIDNALNSGWTENSLILDGDDDWVKMSYIYYDNMTIEIVAKDLNKVAKTQEYLSNAETGGIAIAKNPDNNIKCISYVNNEYSTIIAGIQSETGKIYSISSGIDGKNQYIRTNDNMINKTVTSNLGKPELDTIFAIGTNPRGTSYLLGANEMNAKIEVYSVRIYNRCLTEEEIQKNYNTDKERYEIDKEKITAENLGYQTDGLMCLYDGLNNTQYGHENTVNNWVDISGNNQNGELKGTNYTQLSGWTNNSLILDGNDDYVTMPYMHYNNITVEIVCSIKNKISISQQFIANVETGGIQIYKSSTNINATALYIGGEYRYIYGTNTVEQNKIYSLSAGYNGSNQFFKENSKITNLPITGIYKEPDSSTVFMIGTNPSGTSPATKKSNIEVYSVRIYNRALTETELNENYKIDKDRFEINE